VNLKPLPGHALCEIETQFKEQEGLIYIPKLGRRVKGKIGRCLAITLWSDVPAWIWKNGHKVLVDHACHMNGMYDEIGGRRVAFEAYGEFHWGDKLLANVRLEHIVAEIAEDVDAKVEGDVGGVPRCTHCRSKGELNIMLDSSGYCPECGQNARGERKDGKPDQYGIPLNDRITDDEKEAFDPSPKQVKGTITSYPGVK
jgi:hypothetical protein